MRATPTSAPEEYYSVLTAVAVDGPRAGKVTAQRVHRHHHGRCTLVARWLDPEHHGAVFCDHRSGLSLERVRRVRTLVPELKEEMAQYSPPSTDTRPTRRTNTPADLNPSTS